MDDLEFRTRAYSNPLDDGEDFTAAAAATPERRKLLDELKELERDLQHTLTAIDVPANLKQKLHQHARPAPTMRRRSMLALAASLVVTAGLGLNLFIQPGPSAQDLALHDDIVEHLHEEAPEYENSGASGDVSWAQIEDIMMAAGASLKEPGTIVALHITFARLCGLGDNRGAHLVTQGEHGPISLIFIKATPVSTGFDVKDDRFQGRIIPVSQGNMAVVGEKNESLERYEQLLRDNIEWSI